MSYINFSVRLDAQTARLLRLLAEAERRKRGDYLRLLIRQEATRRGLEKSRNQFSGEASHAQAQA